MSCGCQKHKSHCYHKKCCKKKYYKKYCYYKPVYKYDCHHYGKKGYEGYGKKGYDGYDSSSSSYHHESYDSRY